MSIESENIIALYERHADAWLQARLLESTLYEKPWLDRFSVLLPSPDRSSTAAAVQEKNSERSA